MLLTPRRRTTLQGFTLFELLVSVTILAVLVTLLIPIIGMAREQAQRLNCASRLRGWGIAIQGWAVDHQGRIPSSVYQSGSAGVNFEPAHLWLNQKTTVGKDEEISIPGMTPYLTDGSKTYSASKQGFYRAWGCPDWDARMNSGNVYKGNYGSDFVEFPGYMYFGQRWRSNLAAIRNNSETGDRGGGSTCIVMTDTCWNWGGYLSANHLRRGVSTGGNRLYGDGRVAWNAFTADCVARMNARSLTLPHLKLTAASTMYYYGEAPQ